MKFIRSYILPAESAIMKLCEFCEREMKRQNYRKHYERCLIRLEFNLPKSVIHEAIGNRPVGNNVEDQIMNEKLMIEKTKLIDVLKRFTEESSSLLLSDEIQTCSFERIGEMNLAARTKYEYQVEWKNYQQWCSKRKMNPTLTQTANNYLAQLQTQTSTLKNKRNRLQSIIRHLTGQSIILARIRRRIRRIPKYKLSSEEIENYLQEQKRISKEDYLVQLILAMYGCRINSCSGLRLRHLEFLQGGNTIVLPDTKTGDRVVQATPKLQALLSKFVEKRRRRNLDEFVFDAGRSSYLHRRSNNLCIRINKRIRDSSVLKKSPNYKFSSHMFRHSKAFQTYREHLEKAKEAAREAIGHEKNSSSINFYLNMEPGG